MRIVSAPSVQVIVTWSGTLTHSRYCKGKSSLGSDLGDGTRFGAENSNLSPCSVIYYVAEPGQYILAFGASSVKGGRWPSR